MWKKMVALVSSTSTMDWCSGTHTGLVDEILISCCLRKTLQRDRILGSKICPHNFDVNPSYEF
jgi:hypothetical protein